MRSSLHYAWNCKHPQCQISLGNLSSGSHSCLGFLVIFQFIVIKLTYNCSFVYFFFLKRERDIKVLQNIAIEKRPLYIYFVLELASRNNSFPLHHLKHTSHIYFIDYSLFMYICLFHTIRLFVEFHRVLSWNHFCLHSTCFLQAVLLETIA